MPVRTMYGVRARQSGGDWQRVKTKANPKGQWKTRAEATKVLAGLKRRGWVGAVLTLKITVVANQPAVNVWLKGNVVPIAKVPPHLRAAYRDTLYRAARAAKKYGRPIHVNSSFRSMDEQWALYRQNMIAPGRPKPGRPLTAYPDDRAPHMRGIALDIPNARTTPKLIKALRAEGLIDDVPSEIWHLTNHAQL